MLVCYLAASLIEALILVVIVYSNSTGQSRTLTLNTADVIGFYAIWFCLYFFVGRRYLRRRSGL